MHRILFTLGPITIYSYGTFLALAFFISTYLTLKRASKIGISPEAVVDLSILVVVFGLLGARIFYILTFHEYYFSQPKEIIKVWQGGLVFYGGFILATITAIIFLRRKKISIWKFADIAAPNISLGLAVGRIGCFLNGCCFGKISQKFGITFPCKDNSPVCLEQISLGLLQPGTQFSLPVIPSQLYSSLACLFIFLILVLLRDSRNLASYFSKREGMIFWLFLFFYSIFRFFIEESRFYETVFYLSRLTLSQLISLGLIFLSILAFIKLARLPRGPSF